MSFEEFVYEVAEKFYIGKPTDITKDPRFLFRLAILVRAYKTYSILMLLSYPLVQSAPSLSMTRAFKTNSKMRMTITMVMRLAWVKTKTSTETTNALVQRSHALPRFYLEHAGGLALMHAGAKNAPSSESLYIRERSGKRERNS